MKWAIAQLIKQGSQIFEIDELVDFSDVVKHHDEIRKLSKVKVTGTGQLQGKKVVFNLHIEGTMTLPCALTLEDVDYPFTFNYEDSIQPVLSTNQIISCSTDEKSLHMMPIIQQLFASPIQTPNLSLLQNDNPDYTSSTFYTPSDIRSSNSQKSSIKLCFHS